MSPSEHLPKYNELTLVEKFWLRTCFRFVAKDQPVGVSPIVKHVEQRISESQFFLKRFFGDDIFSHFNGKHILDFGCGEGNHVLAIASASKNANIVGIDIQSRFYEAERECQIRELNNVDFILGDSQRLSSESFEFVLSYDSFEHFESPELILIEMTRLLRPKGKLLIKFGPTWMGPFGRHMFNVFRKDRPWMHLIIPEKSVMRIYSVIKRLPHLLERYEDYPDGLNKMTIKKAKQILIENAGTQLESFTISSYLDEESWRNKILRPLLRISAIKELLSMEVIAVLRKQG